MDELIRINYDSKRPTVYGRDLHKALQVKTAYKDWFRGRQRLLLIFERKFRRPSCDKSSAYHRHGKAALHDSAH